MALIKKLPIDLGVRFLEYRKIFFVISTLIVLTSLALVAVRGLNFGVDFRGGTLIEIRTHQVEELGALRSELNSLGLGPISIQEFGQPRDLLVNLQKQDGGEQEQQVAIAAVKEALDDKVEEYRRVEFVGPKVGEELKISGILATVLSLLGIAIYIWIRFEWQFSVAALVALSHDVIATVGFYALTQYEFNLATLAAVLTIAGYSINDTVVIFDRVRDKLRRFKKLEQNELLDRALNKTLSRTILTSVTTLLALVALFLFGGEVLRGLSLGLIFGVLIGTYSSLGLAVPLLSLTDLRSSQDEDEDSHDDKTLPKKDDQSTPIHLG
ncbi:protein translocase subunit SecF [Kiloniella sp. b19]|uniref:protein translocase subunit SecF n=1 Tax=Kiloniella sp. GXU_MW_B19 TaxID=3141326 RepID=UPI0031E23E86